MLSPMRIKRCIWLILWEGMSIAMTTGMCTQMLTFFIIGCVCGKQLLHMDLSFWIRVSSCPNQNNALAQIKSTNENRFPQAIFKSFSWCRKRG